MSNKPFDYIVFIGRFEPPHNGHFDIIAEALKLTDHIIVLVGSANQPRNIKNPFTYDERRSMLVEAFTSLSKHHDSRNATISVMLVRDFKYDDNVWASNVQHTVDVDLRDHFGGWTDKPLKGAIIGHSKDESSFYLRMFPQWELIEQPMNEAVHATDIRSLFFSSNVRYLQGVVPNCVYEFMRTFAKSPAYADLVGEYQFIEKYKKSWEVAPYPPTFVTVDAVVVQSGHILLVKRKALPGRGLWALPGGFINANERMEDSMLRELKEETGIKVPIPVIRGSIKDHKIFDDPGRSLRGRTVTTAWLIEFQPGELPRIRQTDEDGEVDDCRWWPLSSVCEGMMYEDHFQIITAFLGQLN